MSEGPCGAGKFLRRKCVKGCVFAPYFDSDEGTAHFAAVHRVFGASNASKLLMRIPPHCRLDAVITLCYEALARVRDPVYGCVAHIFTLQQQVVNLQAELVHTQARISTLQRVPPPPLRLEEEAVNSVDEDDDGDLQSLAEFSMVLSLPILVHCDNSAAIQITKNHGFHKRTKHIELDCHHVRGLYQSGLLTPIYEPTDTQIADLFTKCLVGPRFSMLLSKMGLVDFHRVHLEEGS